ncbi:KilA-N domain-containing protein [Caedibacter taeniospiralis]|jgi:hypothetical protein|uniref:KilA-N domain-containing protein n=1 Tax=Caedibacter taeniospiralis TaxID=28907 RepID=UPI0037C11BEB
MSNLIISNIVIKQDNSGLFCLNDFHKASGGGEFKRPSKFMVNEQTQSLINEISESPNSGLAYNIVKGGKSSGTYGCKELVYSYAMWISPKFHLQVRWIAI